MQAADTVVGVEISLDIVPRYSVNWDFGKFIPTKG
jgi:hypothetical protein